MPAWPTSSSTTPPMFQHRVLPGGSSEIMGRDMSRLRGVRREDLDEAGQEVWDSIVGTRGDGLIGEDGSMRGPFTAWVQAPQLGRWVARLGQALRSEMSIDRKLIELAIVTVGAHWQAEF